MVFVRLELLHWLHLLRELLVEAQDRSQDLVAVLGGQLNRVDFAILSHDNLEFVALDGGRIKLIK